jgi:hypothetical protein
MRRSVFLLKRQSLISFETKNSYCNENHELTLTKCLSRKDMEDFCTINAPQKNNILYDDALDNYFADLAWKQAMYEPFSKLSKN